jgi:hypothetical protein
MMSQPEFNVHGRIESKKGHRIDGLSVRAYDADRKKDDPLGRATVDEEGVFELTFDATAFRRPEGEEDPIDRMPDLYFEVYDGQERVTHTKNEVMTNVEPRDIEVTIDIDEGNEEEVEKERSSFKTLLLSNPNYFGTLPEADFDPVEPISGNTSYEEVTCLGLHPSRDRLEAVVDIKRPFGYQTGPCGSGSPEYVRFFVEDNGTWKDLGTDHFLAYNMSSGSHPLSYTVTVPIDEPEKFCTVENLLNVRAIVSWNQKPPAGNATWTPVWGNVLDATVQIDAQRLSTAPVGVLEEEGLLTIDDSIKSQLDLNASLPSQSLPSSSFESLKEQYAETDVPSHRFGFAEAKKLTEGALTGEAINPALGTGDITAGEFGPTPGEELGDLLDNLAETAGDTRYEELTCAGYNPDTREVGGVLSIKRSSGYSGGLCTKGSTEYVGFWVEHGGTWHSLGVAEVQVHDLSGAGGSDTVEYAVIRPTNGVPELPCEDLTGLRMRAILSWNTPPTGPAFTPTWGNVLDTHIQPPEGEPLEPGELTRLRLFHVNSARLDQIDDTTGRATNNTGSVDRPFGGPIVIEGDFAEKKDVFDDQTGDVLPGAKPHLYQVFWQKDGAAGSPTQLTNSFNINVFPEDYPHSPAVTKTQSVKTVNGEEYYTYMESATQAVNPRTFAEWPAQGLENGLYTLEVKGFAWDSATSSYVQTNSIVQKIYIYNGFPHTEDVKRPDGSIATVPREEPELSLTMSAGECADITVGNPVTGTYEVRDHFFGALNVRMVPTNIGGVTHQEPVSVSNPGSVVPHPGITPSVQVESGNWTLDTDDLPPCGYTVELVARDRALVGRHGHAHWSRIGVGFCLVESEE